MPVYEYSAFNNAGKTITGVLDADSPKEARIKLRAQRVHVVDLKAIDTGRPKPRSVLTMWVPEFRAKRRRSDVNTVTRQLATLLRSGIPLAQGLSALIEQAGSREVETVLRDVREKVTQGAGLAAALGHHPHYFNELFVNMVKAGEASGNLDDVLDRLASYGQKQDRLRNKIKAALAYPMVMIVFGGLVVFVLVTFVVPNILQVIKKTDQALPLPTRLLVGTTNFLGAWWPFVLVSVLATVVVFKLTLKNPEARFKWDRFKLRIPVLGDLLKKASVSRFAVTFSTLLKSGVPVLDALVIVRNIVDNQVLARTIDEVRERITEGADIASPLKKSGVFPPVVGYMISIGEQSGHLEEVLERIADAYDDEIEISAQKLTSLIEPILIMAMSVVVGFIVIAILMPILEIGQKARK